MIPEKLYVIQNVVNPKGYSASENRIFDSDVCYIRKDIMDETIQVAEDHAYFAGQEKFREKMLEWAKEKMEEYALKTFEKNGDATHWGQRNAFYQMIDKLNSM